LYCIVSIHLYSASSNAHQSDYQMRFHLRASAAQMQ